MRQFLCCVAAAGLAACSSAPTRYFGTEPVAPSVSAARGYAGLPVQVRTVNVPPQLDRAELMREVAPGEFEVREFDHWTAPFGQMVRQTLTEDLAARLPAAAVIYPDASRPDPVANISVNILSFRFQGDRAVMQVSWTVRSPSSVPSYITDGQTTLETSGDDRSGADISASLSAILAQLADRMVIDLSAAAKR
jgi:uncharacterized lipoprotein YmbA